MKFRYVERITGRKGRDWAISINDDEIRKIEKEVIVKELLTKELGIDLSSEIDKSEKLIIWTAGVKRRES
jgi:hypothetical protein